MKAPKYPSSEETNAMPEMDMMPKGEWPGPFGIYKYSKRVVSFNLGVFLPLIVLTYIADIAASYSRLFVALLLYIVLYLFQLSSFIVLIASFKGQKISISEALDKATRLSLRVLAVYILVGLAVIGGLILLIVPGLIILPRLILAPYYVIDKNMGIMESIRTSWKNSEGYVLKTWGVFAVEILFGILTIILVGIYLSIVYSAALIVLYGFINANPGKREK